MNDAAETVLETVNTYGEEVYRSRATAKWVCGGFILHLLDPMDLKRL